MRRTALIFAGVVVALAPRARASDTQLQQTKLANGLRVVVDENHRVPVVSVSVRYDVGQGDDPDGRNGMSEVVLLAMAHKTQHVPENGLDDVIDRAGGRWDHETNPDDTEFAMTVPTNALEKALWLLSDQMGFFKPALDDALIKHSVDLISSERATRVANSPLGLAIELAPTEIYPSGHPYRHTLHADDGAKLASLSVAEVSAFVDKYFIPSNAVLSIVGDVTYARALELANKWFASIPGGVAPPPRTIPLVTLQHEVVLDIDSRVERPVVRMTWPTPPQFQLGDAELDVVANILHGYRIARLSWELITKLKVAGEITARQTSHRYGSTFTITATATPKHTAQEVAAAIDDVLRDLQSVSAPDQDDLDGSLASALTIPTLSMEGSMYRSRQLAQWAIRTGTADYWQTDMHRFETDSPRVQRAAQQYLPLDKRVVELVAPSTTAPVAGRLVKRTVR